MSFTASVIQSSTQLNKPQFEMTPEKIAQQWLDASAATANAKDLTAHLNLISRDVRVTGIPEFDHIGYDHWAERCEQEFSENLLKSVRYDGLKMLSGTDTQIIFRTFETVEGTDGTVNAQGIEVILQKEDDGQWRVVQERVLNPIEAAQDGLV